MRENLHGHSASGESTLRPLSHLKSSFDAFITGYQERLTQLFMERNDENRVGSSRQLPPEFIAQILDYAPLSVFIPEEYGGRGAVTAEALSMLETSSYQSLPLSLMMGINGALFLQPIANYASEHARSSIFEDVLQRGKMGGLMITEPDFGSDALRMKTEYVNRDGMYHVRGLKHWAGLTGMADYWLITARPREENGELGRDVSFFIHDSRRGGIKVEELFNNLGLYMLPYGRNHIDIRVPDDDRLEPRSTGIKMMLDVLHRSRLQFPGMSTGFLRRMLDEAVDHCKGRFVGGASLFTYDQVRARISSLQSYFTASSAMAFFTSRNVPLQEDTSRMDLAANAIKSVSTDYMQSASQHLLQLVGAKGYRLDHIAGRSTVDSRPFQIFEGSNDILYQQISESVLKMMRGAKEANLFTFVSGHPLMSSVADRFKDVLDIEIDLKMAQRKLVELGRAIGRMITMNMTLELGHSGFNLEMIQNSLAVAEREIREILSAFSYEPSIVPMVDPDMPTSEGWRQYL